MGISGEIKNAYDLVLFRYKTFCQSRIIQPFVSMVSRVIIKSVIDVKPVYKEEDSFHIMRAKIKNPGPLGTRGLWDTKSPEGEYTNNIENLALFVNSYFLVSASY